MAGRKRARGEGTIYWHSGTQRWAAEYIVGWKSNGRPDKRTVYGRTPEEVAEKLDQLRRQHKAGTLPVPNRVTVGEWADQWLNEVRSLRGKRGRGLAKNTIEIYENAVRHIKEKYGTLRLKDLTGQHLSDLYVEMRQQGLGLRQCEIVHNTAKQMLRAAVKAKLIPRDVSEDVANPPKTDYDDPRALTPEEFARILDAAKGTRWWYVFQIALDAGLTRGEVVALQWRHVRWDGQTAVLSIVQQGIKHSKTEITPIMKTSRRRRTVPLSPEASAVLREWRDQLRARAGLDILPADAFVFPQMVGRKPRLMMPTAPDVVSHTFAKCAKAAGLHDVTFHNLRHTAATWLAENDVPPKTAAYRLGHSLETMLTYYTRVMGRSQSRAAETMGALLKGVECDTTPPTPHNDGVSERLP